MLDKSAEYCFDWGLKFNASKCHYTIVNNKSQQSKKHQFIELKEYEYLNTNSKNNENNNNENSINNENNNDNALLLSPTNISESDNNNKILSSTDGDDINISTNCDDDSIISITNDKNTNNINDNDNINNNVRITNTTVKQQLNVKVSKLQANHDKENKYYKYLGLHEWNGTNYKHHCQQLKIAALKQISFLCQTHIFNYGMRINTAILVYNMTVKSKLLYSSEVITPSDNTFKLLETTQNQAIMKIIGVCENSSIHFRRILTGIPPIQATWEINRMKYYHKILTNEKIKDDLPGQVLKEEIRLEKQKSNYGTYSNEMNTLFIKYNLQNIVKTNKFTEMKNEEWLDLIKHKIYKQYFIKDLEKLKQMKSTKKFYTMINNDENDYFELKKLTYKQPKELFNRINDCKYRKGMMWLIRYWSGITPEIWTERGENGNKKCIFCDENTNNFIEHVLIKCKNKKIKNKKERCNIYCKTNNEIEKTLFNNNKNLYNIIKFLNEIYNNIDYLNEYE